MNTARIIAPLLILLALAGCAGSYNAPAGAPTATLIAIRGKVSGLGTAQGYSSVANETCKPTVGTLGMFHTLGSDDTFQIKIAANQRLYIKAISTGSRVVYITMCHNLVSFVPEADATYTISQTNAGQRCSVVLLDAKTNAAPPSLQVHSGMACE